MRKIGGSVNLEFLPRYLHLNLSLSFIFKNENIMSLKNEITHCIGEFFGTAFFLFLGNVYNISNREKSIIFIKDYHSTFK
jgi:hypothetical protein